MEVAKLKTHGRHHASKYMEAFVFGQELAAFWGDYDSLESPEEDSQEGWEAFFAKRKSKAAAARKLANEDKMAGFYVDMVLRPGRFLACRALTSITFSTGSSR